MKRQKHHYLLRVHLGIANVPLRLRQSLWQTTDPGFIIGRLAGYAISSATPENPVPSPEMRLRYAQLGRMTGLYTQVKARSRPTLPQEMKS